MAFDETFKRRVDIDEERVYALTRQAQTVRELQPSNFDGPIAEWADGRMQDYGDTIIPRYVYDDSAGGRPHKVAWIYHAGVDFDDGESFCRHHIACDCLLESERSGDAELMFGCNALLSVLNKRAWFINDTYSAQRVLRQIPALPKEALFGANSESMEKAFAIATMGYILEHDVRHPEAWVGNILDGEHQATLLALILQQDPDEVRENAEIMERNGAAEFDGETIKLSEEEREKIRLDKENRSVIERFKEELRKLD